MVAKARCWASGAAQSVLARTLQEVFGSQHMSTAHFGLKPSEYRVPAANQVSCSRRGSFGIRAVVGPLARSLRDIDYFMKAVLDRDAWNYDPDALAVLWRTPALQAASKPKLTLGLLLEDETRPLHPPVLRAMKTAIKGLEAAGHRIIDLSRKLPTGIFDKVMRSAMQSFVLDPAKTGADYIKSSGEPFIASLAKSSLPELTGYQPSLDDPGSCLRRGASSVRLYGKSMSTRSWMQCFYRRSAGLP